MENKILQWAVTHDDRWLFTGLYIGLSVILSIAISLFWLLAVVLAHAALEWLSLRNNDEDQKIAKIFWHLKLDFGLVLFAICLGIYMEAVFGLVGLGAAARSGAQISTRFVVWQRTVRGILLTLDDVAQVSRAAFTKKTGPDDPEPSAQLPPWRLKWGAGDWISLTLLAVCLSLIVFSPVLLNQGVWNVFLVVAAEMHPWP